ncbi:MAG: hypothetical protein AB7S92_19870 [Parvibaculaceae bacterium]
MSGTPDKTLSAAGAVRLEAFIIGLGLLALILIFQPVSLTLFAVGSGLVVLAGLLNNLLPLARAGTKIRSLVTVALVVALIFCAALLVSIAAAHLYGVFFLKAPDPATTAGKVQLATPPFYMQPLVWGLVFAALCFAAAIAWLRRK